MTPPIEENAAELNAHELERAADADPVSGRSCAKRWPGRAVT